MFAIQPFYYDTKLLDISKNFKFQMLFFISLVINFYYLTNIDHPSVSTHEHDTAEYHLLAKTDCSTLRHKNACGRPKGENRASCNNLYHNLSMQRRPFSPHFREK